VNPTSASADFNAAPALAAPTATATSAYNIERSHARRAFREIVARARLP
jgi:hypothetical protein